MSVNTVITNMIKSPCKAAFIYGTAWKKDKTTELVQQALAAGFTGIDTAAQPKHYREDLVGEGLRAAYRSGLVTRDQLFIQTKFTSPSGQDPKNMPYNRAHTLEDQINTSLASSLRHLRPSHHPYSEYETYIDCFLLHSPLRSVELTIQAWKILEPWVPSRIRSLGISNVSLEVLQAICLAAIVKPAVVQNRFYAATRYDFALRQFCREQGIVYQSFWTLTGNKSLPSCPPVISLSEAVGVSGEVALYSLVMALDIAVLNGTTNEERMQEDIEGVMRVQKWSGENKDLWEKLVKGFEEQLAK